MAEPLTTAAIGTTIVGALKEVGKWIWNYAKSTVLSLWDNKWIIVIAGTTSGIFFYYYRVLYSWFVFPPLLNIAIIGIFALTNITWVASYWKSPPTGNNSGEEPRVNVS